MSRSRLLPLFSALAVALLLTAPPARADEAQEINLIFKQGQQDKALERANSYLATHPKDAQVRFIKGLILTEQNKTAEAIKIFSSITDDYPELPEPYNNLAVLYASLGQYEKSKTALEMAINTHPSYATAHENLGDIYAKMASQAYDKALQLDKGNTNAQAKLALIKDIFTKQTVRKPTKATIAASSVAVAPPAPKPMAPAAPPAPPVAALPSAATKPAPPAARPIVEPAKPVAEPIKTTSEQAKPAATEKPAADAKGGKEAVADAVHAWAKAWSAKNVSAYLQAYASDLVLAKGESRASWEKTRKDRISKPKSIEVSISSMDVKISDTTHARVSFKQSYRAPGFSGETWKTLMMVKSNGKWLIHEERIGR